MCGGVGVDLLLLGWGWEIGHRIHALDQHAQLVQFGRGQAGGCLRRWLHWSPRGSSRSSWWMLLGRWVCMWWVGYVLYFRAIASIVIIVVVVVLVVVVCISGVVVWW